MKSDKTITLEAARFLGETEHDKSTEVHVKPSDMILSESGAAEGNFGKHEVEEAAGRLLKFLQQKNYWHSFTYEELIEFYKRNNWDPVMILYGLHGNWFDETGLAGVWRDCHLYIGQGNDGRLYVTDYFVFTCLQA